MVKDKLTNQLFLMEKEQLLEAIKEVVNDSVQSTNKSQKTYVYGINGLASILGCSRPTAQRIKSSGKLDEAISQNGRTIIVHVEKALELIRLDRKFGKKYPYVPSRRIC